MAESDAASEQYAALKARAAETKRLAAALQAELGLPLVSSAITVGVDGRGGLKVTIIAEGIDGVGARRLIRAALDAGCKP